MRANERASERGRKGNRGREGWIGGERKREDGVGRKEREREEERLRAMERRRLSAWRWTGAEPQKVAQPAPLLLFLCPSRFYPYLCPRLLSDQEESSSLGPGCEASFIRHLSASQPGLGLTLHAVAQCRSPASRVQFARPLRVSPAMAPHPSSGPHAAKAAARKGPSVCPAQLSCLLLSATFVALTARAQVGCRRPHAHRRAPCATTLVPDFLSGPSGAFLGALPWRLDSLLTTPAAAVALVPCP